MTTIYADAISNINLREGVVRIELEQTDPSDEKKVTRSDSLVVSIAGLLRMHDMLTRTIEGMVEKGILEKTLKSK